MLSATPLCGTPYKRQLDLKGHAVNKQLAKLCSGLELAPVNKDEKPGRWVKCASGCVVPSPSVAAYETLVTFAIGTDSEGQASCGFYVSASSGVARQHPASSSSPLASPSSSLNAGGECYPVGSPASCLNVSRAAKLIAKSFTKYLRGTWNTLPVYNAKTRTGFWKCVVVKEGLPYPDACTASWKLSHGEGTRSSRALLIDVHVNVHGSSDSKKDGLTLQRHRMELASLLRSDTQKASFCFVQDVRFTNAITGLQLHPGVLVPTFSANATNAYVVHRVLGKPIAVGVGVRFPSNVASAENFYQRLPEMLGIKASSSSAGILLDIYCGSGVVSVLLAHLFSRCLGIDENSDAVATASLNAALNGVENAAFVEGDAVAELENLVASERCPLVTCIVTAPRRGASKLLMRKIAACTFVQRVLYVCTKPDIAVRDARELLPAFTPRNAWAFDFSPHTTLAEMAVLLQRTSA